MPLIQNQKMTPQLFVESFLSYAKECEKDTGISAVAILAQAALESSWNGSSPSWMFFGVKDTDGVNGNEQLLTTTEYSRRQDLTFPVILKVVPVIRNGQTYFKYTVKDYFRKYDTPADCFKDHCRFFMENPRYKNALEVKYDPYRFSEEIAKAGYATDPNYAEILKKICKMIEKYI